MALIRYRNGWPLSLLGLAAALAVSVAHFTLALRGAGPGRFPDLYVYRGAVESLASGRGLYDFAAANGDPFTYPPVAALLLYPLVWIPAEAMELVWFLAEIVTAAWIAVAIARIRFPHRRVASVAPWLGLLLAVSAPMGAMVEFGQLSIFVLAAIVAAMVARNGPALLGAAAAVKLLPGGAFPVLFAQGRRKAALVAAAVCSLATATAWAILPTESARFWFQELPSGTNYGDTSLIGNQSLMGVLARTGLDAGVIRPLWLILVMIAVGWATFAAARVLHRTFVIESLLLVAALIVVVSPVSWTHHQLLLVFSALLPVSRSRWRQALWSIAVVVIMTVNLWNLLLPGPFGWIMANSRFLLSMVLLVGLPHFARGAHARRDRGQRPRSSAGAAVAVTASLALLAGCSPTPRAAVGAAPEATSSQVTIIRSGDESGTPWQFGYRTQQGEACLVMRINAAEQQFGCAVPVNDAMPLNFGIANDAGLVVVAGAATDDVETVEMRYTTGSPARTTPLRVLAGRPRVFALVVPAARTPEDLVALGSHGQVLATGGDKFAQVARPDRPR